MIRSAALLALVVVALLARAPQSQIGCRGCDEVTWGYTQGLFNRYSVGATQTTPDGIRFDASGLATSATLIDRLTNEVERCLFLKFPERLSDVAAAQAGCSGDARFHTIDRHSFVVKVAGDWRLTCDGQQQVLPVVAPSAGCAAKGQHTTPECPCSYRAGIKCPNILVVTPSLYIYKDVLIRFLYDCVDPWANADLATCATPSTQPLSDGSIVDAHTQLTRLCESRENARALCEHIDIAPHERHLAARRSVELQRTPIVEPGGV